MLYKSLILGFLFSMGVFAVKSGIGIFYATGKYNRPRNQIFVLFLYCFAYALVFGLAVPFILSSGLTHYPATIQAFMKSGIITPLVLAGLMIAWTLLLLKKRPVHVIKNYGWLFLMFPCPVCAAVVLFSTAFFISIYPNQLVLIITSIYLIFLLVGFTTMIICRRFQPKEAGFPDTFLGGLMLLTGIYFLLSAIIVPQFTDLTGVYRMAGYHTGTISRGTSAVLWPMLVVTTAFVLGCFFTFKKIRSLK